MARVTWWQETENREENTEGNKVLALKTGEFFKELE